MGTLVLFRANLACFTNSFKDFALSHQLAPKRIKLLSLRHGRSVKRVRFARLKHKLLKAEKRSRLQEASQTIGVISTSKFISEIQEECLRLGKSKHFITGYPRLDHLLKPRKNSKYSKTILYAPTWRHGRQQTRFFPFKDYNPQKLIKFLEDHHILLLLRPHVNDWVKYPKLQDQLNQLASLSTHIKLATHYQVADIYTILPSIDVLISDYSSIYHDFLLLDKPILLIPYDFAKFEKENGFLYNYQKLAPGPIIKTQRSLLAHINKDNYVSKREVLRNKIFQYQDTGSSARVAKLLNKLMQS